MPLNATSRMYLCCRKCYHILNPQRSTNRTMRKHSYASRTFAVVDTFLALSEYAITSIYSSLYNIPFKYLGSSVLCQGLRRMCSWYSPSTEHCPVSWRWLDLLEIIHLSIPYMVSASIRHFGVITLLTFMLCCNGVLITLEFFKLLI